MAGLKTEAVAWSTDIKKVIALCHDLVPLSKGQVVGRLDEKKAFADVEAAFMVRHAPSVPPSRLPACKSHYAAGQECLSICEHTYMD